jgi:hypothetical protein
MFFQTFENRLCTSAQAAPPPSPLLSAMLSRCSQDFWHGEVIAAQLAKRNRDSSFSCEYAHRCRKGRLSQQDTMLVPSPLISIMKISLPLPIFLLLKALTVDFVRLVSF